MEITQNVCGFTPEGEAVIIYTMRNAAGAEVRLLNLGATIMGVRVPDRAGRIEDVALGYDEWQSYMADGPAMGKSVGRVANRIGGAKFTLDGREYRLTPVSGQSYALHGGPTGFMNRLWQGRVEGDRVVFSYMSADGEEGYPGGLAVEAVYGWDDECRLSITYLAKCTAPTVVNLTNHAYFNLAGEGAGSVLGHTLKINATHWLPTDATQVPTGEIAPVKGTPMDFTEAKTLGRDIDADYEPLHVGRGYDHCWMPDGFSKGTLREVAVLRDEASGRVLTVSSTQPALQVYTGNWLDGCPSSMSGRAYHNRDGVALECQGCPDAPNKPQFPSQRLDPEELYNETIIFKFSTK